MTRILLIFLFAISIASCSNYQKLLKSDDYDLVYRHAIDYYQKSEYRKANDLFDKIRSVFGGTSKAQSIAYYRAYCAYNMKDYSYASELFKQFVISYPESSFAEECYYMIGYCNYKSSPKPRLDQSLTRRSINDFQTYLSRYPNSTRKEEIHTYLDEMNDKLAYKDYLNAKNYFLREYYKAAVISLQNCIKDYPASKYREEILYLLFDSKYEMAVNSVEDKKLERYNAAKEEYYFFVEEYPESAYIPELAKKYDHINKFLADYDFDD